MQHSAGIYHGICMLHVVFLRQKHLNRNSDDTITSSSTNCSTTFFSCFPTFPTVPRYTSDNYIYNILICLFAISLLVWTDRASVDCLRGSHDCERPSREEEGSYQCQPFPQGELKRFGSPCYRWLLFHMFSFLKASEMPGKFCTLEYGVGTCLQKLRVSGHCLVLVMRFMLSSCFFVFR